MSKKIETLKLESVKFPSKLQPRVALNADALEDYKLKAKQSKERGGDIPFPPMKAIRRNGDIIAYSGFHRRVAIKHAGYDEAAFDVKDDNEITDDGIFLLSLKENQEHGVRYSADDKAHNLARVIAIPGNEALTSAALAELAGVSVSFANNHRPASKAPTVRITKKGSKIDVSRIHKKGVKGKAEKPKKEKKAKPAKAGKTAPQKPDKSPEKPVEKYDDATIRAIRRIVNVLGQPVGASVQKAIDNDVIKISAAEIRAWAAKSDSLIVKIGALVIDRSFTVTKAIAFIDKNADATTRADHFVNRAVSGEGIDFSETVDNHVFCVFNKDKYKLEHNKQTNTIVISPKK